MTNQRTQTPKREQDSNKGSQFDRNTNPWYEVLHRIPALTGANNTCCHHLRVRKFLKNFLDLYSKKKKRLVIG